MPLSYSFTHGLKYAFWILILSVVPPLSPGAAGDPSALIGSFTEHKLADFHSYAPPMLESGVGLVSRDLSAIRRLAEEVKDADTPQKRHGLLEPAARALVNYLRYLDSRLMVTDAFNADYSDAVLQSRLKAMSCVSMAVLATPAMQATAVVFPNGFMGRISADLSSLSLDFSESCAGKLQPFAFHQHERAQDLPNMGALNDEGACEAAKTGGHHDPGFACGPTGSSDCPTLNIPPSSALRGTDLFTGTYTCTPEVYKSHPFACHAGDFSGKYGDGFDASIDPSRADIRIIAQDSNADNPCAAADKKQSLVIHCHSTNKRIACAPFERIEAGGAALSQKLHHMIATLSVVISDAKPESEEQPAPTPSPPDAEAPSPEQEEVQPQLQALAAEEAVVVDHQYLNLMATVALILQIEDRVSEIESAVKRQQKIIREE